MRAELSPFLPLSLSLFSPLGTNVAVMRELPLSTLTLGISKDRFFCCKKDSPLLSGWELKLFCCSESVF